MRSSLEQIDLLERFLLLERSAPAMRSRAGPATSRRHAARGREARADPPSQRPRGAPTMPPTVRREGHPWLEFVCPESAAWRAWLDCAPGGHWFCPRHNASPFRFPRLRTDAVPGIGLAAVSNASDRRRAAQPACIRSRRRHEIDSRLNWGRGAPWFAATSTMATPHLWVVYPRPARNRQSSPPIVALGAEHPRLPTAAEPVETAESSPRQRAMTSRREKRLLLRSRRVDLYTPDLGRVARWYLKIRQKARAPPAAAFSHSNCSSRARFPWSTCVHFVSLDLTSSGRQCTSAYEVSPLQWPRAATPAGGQGCGSNKRNGQVKRYAIARAPATRRVLRQRRSSGRGADLA